MGGDQLVEAMAPPEVFLEEDDQTVNETVAACIVPNNSEELLAELNDEKAVLYLPVIIYMGVLLLVGTFGNILVCCVYCSKRRKGSSDYFILSLAVLDMISCVVGMPTEIADLRFPLKFNSPAACKLLRYSESSTIVASALILIDVAFDRYFRICKISKVFSSKKTKRLCIGAIIFGFVISWPTAIIFGRKTAGTRIPCLTGVDCSTTDEMRDTIFPKLWYGFLGLTFVMCLLFLTVLYICIGVEVWKRKNSNIGEKMSPNSRKRWEEERTRRQSSADDSSCAVSVETSQSNGKHNSIKSKPNKTSMKPRRTTLVLFVVTLAFVISFLPFLIVMILRSFVADFEMNLTPLQEVVYKFCLKSYFINSAVNPVIYSFLNENFRRLVGKQIHRAIGCCLSTDSKQLNVSKSNV